MANDSELLAAEAELRVIALALPEATEDFPWGERVVKVRKKIFVFLGIVAGDDRHRRLRVGVKLTASHGEAMSLPFVVPTGYGLGRAGWVTATFAPGEQPITGLLAAWIRESYRNVAPKRLAARVDG
jgi:predicted DNA-binding protein (MmcQ/YjbR family)